MQRSSIEWTELTWNPLRGCTEIGPGCDNCYARQFAERFRGKEGHPYEQGFDFRLVPHKLTEPLELREPHRIFVNSMSDMFHGKCPEKYIENIAEVMLEANWHVFQILTKRSARMKRIFSRAKGVLRDAAHAPNILWGVSAEDHEHGARRIADLQEADVKNKWVSFEPLLEDLSDVDLTGIDWAVIGGESGPHSRPMPDGTVHNMLKSCRRQHVAFLFKQWGGTQKKKTGRTLNGRTYDEFPAVAGAEVPARDDRRRMIDTMRATIRSRWHGHGLALIEQWMKNETTAV